MDDNILNKLHHYESLLKKWQSKINLVSNATLPDLWDRHFEDSIQVTNLVPLSAKNLFDIGSGAGFPGLVVGIMRPELSVTLIESDQKKCSFLKTVSRETDTKTNIINDRIENVSRETIPDVISARALASLDKLFDYCADWIEANPELILMFPKGAKYEAELDELAKNWTYDYEVVQSKTSDEAKILVFSKACRK